ncbi:MAG: histidine kinase [Bacteroidales bacterium]|nr:histidine kinase [Bacteroidales bacterium]
MQQNHIALQQDQKAGAFRDLELFKTLLQPHFLFNSLNNLYALAVKRSDQTTDAIAGLSDLLAKVVNCSLQEYISLDQEVSLMKDYVRLERIWLQESGFVYDIQVSGEVEEIQIPPLVLYTFIENCFKHGIRKYKGEGWLTVKIEVEDGVLLFKAKNCIPSFNDEEAGYRTTNAGLGILAVRELLDRKCAGKYDLKAGCKGKTYQVELRIDCK